MTNQLKWKVDTDMYSAKMVKMLVEKMGSVNKVGSITDIPGSTLSRLMQPATMHDKVFNDTKRKVVNAALTYLDEDELKKLGIKLVPVEGSILIELEEVNHNLKEGFEPEFVYDNEELPVTLTHQPKEQEQTTSTSTNDIVGDLLVFVERVDILAQQVVFLTDRNKFLEEENARLSNVERKMKELFSLMGNGD